MKVNIQKLQNVNKDNVILSKKSGGKFAESQLVKNAKYLNTKRDMRKSLASKATD